MMGMVVKWVLGDGWVVEWSLSSRELTLCMGAGDVLRNAELPTVARHMRISLFLPVPACLRTKLDPRRLHRCQLLYQITVC
jgi:hypothetical protein